MTFREVVIVRSPDDLAAPYVVLKESGASPQAIYSAAKANGLEKIAIFRLLRSLFGMSLPDMKKVISSVDGVTPDIESYEQLLKVLEAELGHCSCASPGTLLVLRNFLQAAQDRTDAINDNDAFGHASCELEACLRLEESREFAYWFVFGLEQRELVWHGFRLTDTWITDKGRWLLEAIKRLSPPQTADE